jgi:hypothetical protein
MYIQRKDTQSVYIHTYLSFWVNRHCSRENFDFPILPGDLFHSLNLPYSGNVNGRLYILNMVAGNNHWIKFLVKFIFIGPSDGKIAANK